jgi:cellulose synthase/poly-beta-1,6-N-acetylglucosamine synthase-like glycosyltransferase
VLNDLLPKASGEIVVLADARQTFEPGAVRALVACFADPRVGAVTGDLVLRRRDDGGAVGDAVGLYWRYEKFIRSSESRAESVAGVTGAIYAVRRELFEPIAADTILDDVLIPLRIARRGYRVLLEPRARAHDRAPATAREEFTRKARTMAGKFQMFARERWLLSPFGNRLWLANMSRNGLRLVVPFLLVAALGANLGLAATPFYRLTLAAQLAFYGAALAGYVAGGRRLGLLSVPYVFCLLNAAIVVGLARFVSGRQQVTWDKASGR